ncbi:DNA mismatch repair protein MSH3 [Linum perenne]
MGKQKQLVISRFFAPKPKPSSDDPPPPSPPPPPPPTTTSSPKIATTVSFSPAKRKLLADQLNSKRPKLSPQTQNPNPSFTHQQFLDKLLEPTPIEFETLNPQSSIQNYTPLEQQVVELKSKYPDVILMIEVGYKYRFFGEDAGVASRVLGIYAHVNHNFLTASIPTVRLNVHVRRLVSAGYKVGVVKQTETAAIKAHGENRTGPFCRGLSALYTKATLEAAEGMGEKEEGCGGESNYMCCVVEKNEDCGIDVKIGIVGVEISTGDVVYGEFSDGIMRNGLEALVLGLAPAELLLGDPLSKPTEKVVCYYHCFKEPGINELLKV